VEALIQPTELEVLWKSSSQVRRFELELVVEVAVLVQTIGLQTKKVFDNAQKAKVDNAKTLLIHLLSSL
jgi:hypothetical protein